MISIDKYNYFVFYLLFLTTGLFTGCAFFIEKPNNPGDTIVGRVDNEPVTLSELKANFEPSLDADSVTNQDLVDFLPLYLNHKVKLKAAREAGYLEKPELKKELNKFGEESAYTYWLENVVNKEMLDEYESRKDVLLAVSHLLVRLPPDAAPSDTARVYKRLMEARKKYKRGTPFDSLIEQYASTRNNKKNGGDLGYITAGSTVKPFEDAAYSLAINSISMPIRTKFGYHLIVVRERKERPPDRRISHIFFNTGGKDAYVDSALKRANKAYRALQSGMSWEEAVKRFSEDPVSARKSGKIGWVNYSQFQPAFSDSVFNIDTIGKPTKPILSNSGVHILKIDSVRSYDSVEQKRADYLGQLQQLPRYEEENRRKIVLEKVREAENAQLLRITEKKLINFVNQTVDTLTFKEITLPDSLDNLVHYTFSDSSYTANDYLNWLKRKYPNQPVHYYKNRWLQKYEDFLARKHIIHASLIRFPDYVIDYNDYKNSLAVFEISQDSIWTYGENDTAALKQYFNNHRSRYKYPDRFLYSTITTSNESTLKKAVDLVRKGTPLETIPSKIDDIAIQTDSLSTLLVNDPIYKKLNDLSPGSFSEPFIQNKVMKILYFHRKLDARPMSFPEAYNLVLSDYQEEREKQWLASLHQRYQVEAYKNRLWEALTVS